jgi:hypothetical protein
MGFKNFLQKILNTLTKKKDKKNQLSYKNNKSSTNNTTGVIFNPSTENTSNLQLFILSQISLSQLEQANLAATQIRYFPTNNYDETPTGISNKRDLSIQKINVSVNGGLLPIPAGLIAMLDICNSSLYTFTKTN